MKIIQAWAIASVVAIASCGGNSERVEKTDGFADAGPETSTDWVRSGESVVLDGLVDGRAGDDAGDKETVASDLDRVGQPDLDCADEDVGPEIPCKDVVHVNAGSAAGTSADGTEAKPFPTIQEGVDAACPGAKVLVAEGYYEGGAVVKTPQVQIIGADSASTVVASEACAIGFTITADGVSVSNLRLVGGRAGILAGKTGTTIKGLTLSKIVVEDLDACSSSAGWMCDDLSPVASAVGVGVTHADQVLIEHVDVSDVMPCSCCLADNYGFALENIAGLDFHGNSVSWVEGGTGLDWGAGAAGVWVRCTDCVLSGNLVEHISGGTAGFYGDGGVGAGIVVVLSPKILLEDNTVRHVYGGSCGEVPECDLARGILVAQSSHAIVRNNTVGPVSGSPGHDGGDAAGLWVEQSEGVSVLGNEIADVSAGEGGWDAPSCSMAEGIVVDDSPGFEVSGNVIRNVRGGASDMPTLYVAGAILVHDQADGAIINNTIHQVESGCGDKAAAGKPTYAPANGIYLDNDDDTGVLVENNIIAAVDGFCLRRNEAGDPNRLLAWYSDLWQCTFGTSVGAVVHASCLAQSPQYADPDGGDLALQNSSPCIDAGNPLSDYELEPEPNGCRINMGASGNTPAATSKPGAPHCPAYAVPDAVCGDGLVQAPEECDDGNAEPCDQCLPDCTAPRCGDAFVCGQEACDDGNTDAADACTSSCQTSEFLVSPESEDGFQGLGATPLKGGKVAVVWTRQAPTFSFGESIAGRVLCPDDPDCGEELTIAEDVGGWCEPVPAALPNGGYVVAWRTNDFDADCDYIRMRKISQTDEPGPLLDLATTCDGNSTENPPAVAVAESGATLVLWRTDDAFLTGDGLDYVVLAPDQTPMTEVLALVPGGVVGIGGVGSVPLSDGSFAVIWVQKEAGYAAPWLLWEAVIGPDAAVETTAAQLSGDPVASSMPCLAALPDDRIALFWEVPWGDWYRTKLEGRIVKTDLSYGPAIEVDPAPPSSLGGCHVGTRADGSFVLAWQSLYHDGESFGVFARSYSDAALPTSKRHQVNTLPWGDQFGPAAAALPDGRFLVVFQSHPLYPADGPHKIMARWFEENE